MFSVSFVLTIQHSILLWEMNKSKQRKITVEVEEMGEKSTMNCPASKTLFCYCCCLKMVFKPIN